jgi:predicted Zn-dependent protease with MMP-like domain
MNPRRFERLAAEALDSLPREFLVHLENVEIVVEEYPSEEDLLEADIDPGERIGLLGLYVGVPLTERDTHYAGYLPDRIILFQRPIEAVAGEDPEAVRQEVRTTVIHEVAHYYGIDEERLEELGWA